VVVGLQVLIGHVVRRDEIVVVFVVVEHCVTLVGQALEHVSYWADVLLLDVVVRGQTI